MDCTTLSLVYALRKPSFLWKLVLVTIYWHLVLSALLFLLNAECPAKEQLVTISDSMIRLRIEPTSWSKGLQIKSTWAFLGEQTLLGGAQLWSCRTGYMGALVACIFAGDMMGIWQHPTPPHSLPSPTLSIMKYIFLLQLLYFPYQNWSL